MKLGQNGSEKGINSPNKQKKLEAQENNTIPTET